MPESGRFPVESHGDILRFIIGQYFIQHVEKSENSLGIHAVSRNHRPLDGIIRPIHETVAVYDDKCLFHRISFYFCSVSSAGRTSPVTGSIIREKTLSSLGISG